MKTIEIPHSILVSAFDKLHWQERARALAVENNAKTNVNWKTHQTMYLVII
jgi:hypothetical protein